MRYDDGMNAKRRRGSWAGQPLCLALAASCALMLAACRGGEDGEATAPASKPGDFGGTTDPELAQTLQAVAAGTAAWVAELEQEATAAPTPVPTLEGMPEDAVTLGRLTGECETPPGYRLHMLDVFCIAAPEGWRSLNIDGGVAASLNTTPGQAIGLRPDWAAESDVCSILLYVTEGESSVEHLESMYQGFEGRADITELSPITVQSLGDLSVPGFTWASSSGESGGVYADVLGLSRIVHVSHSGTQCPIEDVLPVLQTLRFNRGQ